MRTHAAVAIHLLAVLLTRFALPLHVRGSQRAGNLEKWEKDVRSASSLEELLMLTDFPDWKLWKCRLKLQSVSESPSSVDSRPSSMGSHRSTRYAAASYSLDILNAIDEEWQKTQCMPRETCVDVAKELGSHTNIFFKPPCVSVFRCSGCCNKEGETCRNTSTTYVNKTLLTVIPFTYGPEPVLIKVGNHTECKCTEPTMIRRHVSTHRPVGCNPVMHMSGSRASSRLCPSGLIWDCTSDRCVPYPSARHELSLSPRMPDCEIDVDQCDCVARSSTTLPNSTRSAQRSEPCQSSSSSCVGKG